MLKNFIFTSESVSSGHPDKVCDQISDAILDECLRQDKNSRVAIETGIKSNTVMIFGELTTNAKIDFTHITKKTLTRIGYDNPIWGMDLDNLEVIERVTQQSNEISHGVTKENLELGAGDQGIMFGFATSETESYLPTPIHLAHELMKEHERFRKSDLGKGVGPDAKSQVTVEYIDGKPQNIKTIVISTQHSEDIDLQKLKELIIENLIKPVLKTKWSDDIELHINPSGTFHIGGPIADAGLTGRKIIVDTYGGFGRHGGGAFSGKDPTKVDRSAAYAARQLAKDVVKRGITQRCEVQISYAIGVVKPISITFFTEEKSSDEIHEYYKNILGINLFELLKPHQIIQRLKLKLPYYEQTASYGHFGRDEFYWESGINEPFISAKLTDDEKKRRLEDLEKLGELNYSTALVLNRLKAA